MQCVRWFCVQSEIVVWETTLSGLCSTIVNFVTSEVLRSSSRFDRPVRCFHLTDEVGHFSIDFSVQHRIDTHRFWLFTGFSTCSVTGAVHGADHAYPSGAPDDTPCPYGEFTLQVYSFCYVRLCSAFVLFLCSCCIFMCPTFAIVYRFVICFEYPFGLLLRYSFAVVLIAKIVDE